MDFKEQYKHPAWQKKRLEALNAADFSCAKCGDNESQLHVHHRQYFKGRKIWEYSLEELDVLCESCHEDTHAVNDILKSLLSRIPAEAIDEVIGLLSGYISSSNRHGPISEAAPFVDDNLNQLFSIDPYAYAIGSFAGAVNAFCAAIDSIAEADEKLKSEPRGRESKTVSINIRRNRMPFGEFE